MLLISLLFLSLFPEYPDPPTNVEVSETDQSLLVSWEHSPSLPEGNTATGFIVCLNGEKCCQSSSLSPSSTSQCLEILPKDIKKLSEELTVGSSVQLTVRALAGHLESRDSLALMLSRKQLSLLLSQHSQMLGSEESSSSEVSMSSSEEEKKKTYSPAKVELDESHMTSGSDHVIISNDHVTTVADNHVTNGVEESSRESQGRGNRKSNLRGITMKYTTFLLGPVSYYRALYDYDPFYHSPNEEDVEEELGFKAGDIITVRLQFY